MPLVVFIARSYYLRPSPPEQHLGLHDEGLVKWSAAEHRGSVLRQFRCHVSLPWAWVWLVELRSLAKRSEVYRLPGPHKLNHGWRFWKGGLAIEGPLDKNEGCH